MLAGRYRLQQRLAAGGMGAVYVGMDERLGRRVAVKLLDEKLAVEADFVERFRREARAAASLNHPNIAQVYDHGRDGVQHYIAMELVQGTDLARLLRDRGRLSAAEAVDIGAQVCAALAAAHTGGIVHRDIKPGNIIVGLDGQVKVTDFGIARAMGQTSLTHTGSVLGTAQYLPPEQARGEPAGPTSDLYSLGVVLYQMLTGSVPFTGDSAVAVALRHLHDSVPRPSDSTPQVPAALDQVVLRATAKEPTERFVDATEMAAALQHAKNAPATAQLPSGHTLATAGGTGGRRPGRRRRLAWAAAALVFVTAVAVALALAWGPEDTAPPAAAPGASPGTSADRRAESPNPPRQTSPTPKRVSSAAGERRKAPARVTPSGPLVPAGIVGRDAKQVEEVFKARGYEVSKADIESAAAKDSVLATMPAPGNPLTHGQTLVLLVSTGKAPDTDISYRVPSNVVGADAHDLEERLKARHVHVTKIPVDATAAKDTVLNTYPAAGTRTQGSGLVLLVSSGHPPD